MIYPQPIIFMDDRYNEVWKPLVYEGIDIGEYLISSYGNIYDLRNDRYVSKYICSSNGYVYASLRHNSCIKSGNVLVHRLVALNFVAKKNPDQNQVNHINGIKTCNYAYNLEWTTSKENNNHATRTGLNTRIFGETNHSAVLTNNQVEYICQLLSRGLSNTEILTEVGLENTLNNRSLIDNIYRCKAWRHISCKYIFPIREDYRFNTNSREKIEVICRCLESGMNAKQTYEFINNKPFISYNHPDCKREIQLIINIRDKKCFKDVSKNYNF